LRVGIGYDVHRFEPGRPLVLGGVTIPDTPGLAGHSDADVVCHAVADAVLGACGLGDIGEHFPPGAPEWKDASSLTLLARVTDMARRSGYRVGSIDAVLMLEAPKVSAFRDQMKQNLARILGTQAVGVKATTAEGLGAIGRGEGAACMAVALVEPVDE
jgi:2-C-methyl-D-erythritol 2,4-cyclodiphosphate synthase